MTLKVWQKLHDDLLPGVQPDQASFAVPFAAHTLLLPIRTLADGRGVASLILNQASFAVLDALADDLAARLAPYRPDIIVGVPTLGLPLAEAVARRLGHNRLLPLGNSRKFWYDEALSVDMSSITSPGSGKRLYLDPRMQPLLKGRVAVVDDVLSTGSSIAAVLRLLALVNTNPVVIGAVMLQGVGWRDRTGTCPVEGAFATPILHQTPQGWVAT